MAKTTGLGDNFYIGGFDLSGNVSALSKISGSQAALDVTTIKDSAPERLGGLRDGGMDFNTWMDAAAGAEHAALSGLPTADTIASYFRGTTLGNPCASLNCKQVNYDPTRGTDGSLSFLVNCVGNAFGLEWGVQLTPGLRTDGSATAASSSNSVDTTSSLSFGAQVYMQLIAFTGTSVTLTVNDSADNSSFSSVAGLASPAWTSANQFTRVTISNVSTLRRYVAVASSGTFSNAVFAVQLTKNTTAGVVF